MPVRCIQSRQRQLARTVSLLLMMWVTNQSRPLMASQSQDSVSRQGGDTSATTAPTRPMELARDQRMVTWRIIFFWSIVLLIVFVVGAGVIIRFSERFKSFIIRGERRPTPTEDVWAMHKVPEELNDDDEAK